MTYKTSQLLLPEESVFVTDNTDQLFKMATPNPTWWLILCQALVDVCVGMLG